MKASKSTWLLLAAAGFIVVAGCSQGRGSFGSGTGGGGGGAGGGGGGGGGGPTVTAVPNLVYQLDDQSANLYDLKIAGDASRAVFVTDDNPLGTNSTANEQIFSVTLPSGAPIQITNKDDDGNLDFINFDITDDGSEVVYVSTEDVTGGNPNNFEQIFLAQTDGTGIAQVTSLPTGGVSDPEISGDGSMIVFVSAADFVGNNPNNFAQIYSIQSDGNNLAQVTTGNVGPSALSFADGGSRIAYNSSSDPVGSNADGSSEIFVVDIDGANLMQLTDSAGSSFNPRLSDNGLYVGFVSNGEVTTGSMADGSFEVFVAATDGSGIVQITDTGFNSGTNASGAPNIIDLSGDGATVAFGSQENHSGDNPDLDHTIFWASASGGGFGQFLRPGRVPAGVDVRGADSAALLNDGAGVLFDSMENYNPDATGFGVKIYTHSRN